MELPEKPSFIDRSEHFKSVATSIAQKYIGTHNEKPGVCCRDKKRSSPTFINITKIVLPLATELFLFRKMLDERAQAYIFATAAYSDMTSHERETFESEVRERLSQFESFINQLGHRVNTSDTLQNATERSHLMRVHEGLRSYLKESVDFVSLLKKEHLKRLQAKNKTLADQVKEAKNEGHAFKYHFGLEQLVTRAGLDFSNKLTDRLEELKSKHKCFNYTPQEVEEKEYDIAEDVAVEDKNKNDGWDSMDELDFEEVVPAKKVAPKPRASPILFQETMRNRKLFEADHEQIRESYEKWKNEQGTQFTEQLQQQTAIIKSEFISVDKDDEVERLEQQIAEIQSLSTVFAEKIMDQEREIDVINDLALHTTENLVDGNEWIRKAITNSALRRVILLFCIVVLTFTLLFLDWYNP